VIANAGVSRGTLTEYQEDIAAFQAVMDINVMGMVHTFQPFILAMKSARQQGQTAQLVGVASVAGIRGLPGAGAYSASKAAAINYLESLRSEMQHADIAVTTIAPGYIRTPMTDVNSYAMPFIMDVDVFAKKFAQAVARKKRFCIIPWQMGVVARIMKLIPAWLWDRLTKNAPHKTR
jgi:short-subunit dehydrogenase